MSSFVLCPECQAKGAPCRRPMVNFSVDKLGRVIQHITSVPYNNYSHTGVEQPRLWDIEGTVETREIEA